ncbi:hypothetical protein IWW37_005247 [Coemansia sp. RSA 2050]|nr:hypothetical protein IWW37_005247 [Coemansia sp. RSA 2050]KAJ2730460.1 hypothetical protein IW152_005220 [Coemansia sp. BCRC 34962]
MATTDRLHASFYMTATSLSGDNLHARPLRGLSRSSSSASRKIAALNNLVSSAGRRGSLLAPRESSDILSRRPSIRRVDAAPTATNPAIQAIDALFEHYQREEELTISTASISSAGDDLEESPPSPTATASTLESLPETLAQPELAHKRCSLQPPLIDELMDTLFPHLPPNAKPYHAYYNVATVDGEPTIPRHYSCPTSMCGEMFTHFEVLQTHWSAAHPWNRRGILVPVTAGGIRRLGFWQHKAKFFVSLLQGPHSAGEFGATNRPATSHKQSLWSVLGLKRSCGGIITTSDYGDIRLLGPRSYLVSPRVLPLEQVRVWEAERDDEAKPEPQQQPVPIKNKSHTSLLLRCGIDPWASTLEIRMRRQFGNALLVVLDGYCSRSDNAEYAWSMENLTYSVSYLPKYASSWQDATCDELGSNIQRYHFLGTELLRQIGHDRPLVYALLYNNVHPSVFYISVFGCSAA